MTKIFRFQSWAFRLPTHAIMAHARTNKVNLAGNERYTSEFP